MKHLFYVFFLSLSIIPLSMGAQTVQVCPSVTKYLTVGSRDAQVISLKKYLIAEGYLTNVSITNYFGPATESAVKRWQRARGLVTTGSPRTTGYGAIGPKTRTALKNCKAQVPKITTKQVNAIAHINQPQIQGLSVRQESVAGGVSAPTCVSEIQTRSQSCPAGEVGTITETRTAACPEKVYGVWVETSHACVKQNEPAPQINQPPVVVTPPPSTTPPQLGFGKCIFNNQTLVHGATVTAYKTASVEDGSSCVSEVRTCENGALSGSFNNETCSVVPTACQKPRYYRFTEPASKSLTCSTYTPIFGEGEIIIPDTGFAFVRARFTPSNSATLQEGAGVASAGVYSWGAQIIFNANPADVFKTSEAMCPGSSPEQHVAYGWVDQNAGTNRIRVEGTAIRTGCIPGRLNVFGGRVLEVWVEDPKPECQKKDIIAYTSWRDVAYGTIQQPLKIRNHGSVEVKFGWVWPTMLTQLPNTTVVVPDALPGRTRLKLYSSIEGSPFDTPQLACGAQTSAAQFVLKDGNSGVELQRLGQTLPSGTGITHMNFGHTYEVTGADAIRSRQFGLFVSTNAPSLTDIYTGGNAGQVTVGVIRD